MRKSICLISAVLSVAFCAIFFSCKNSYNSVIDSFNGKYFHEEASGERFYSIYSPDFNRNTMLADSYDLKKLMTLSLIAPDGGSAYKWTAIVQDIEDRHKENEIDIGNEKKLSYRLPGVFRDDCVNKLVLTVTDNSGTEYKDTALIILE